jgi:hypothetical protein
VQVNGQLEETIEPREYASTQHHLGGSAAFPQRRRSNANSLSGQNSAGSPQICAIFQRDILSRHI